MKDIAKFNYLSLINSRLAEDYSKRGVCFLSKSFEPTQEDFEERICLNQISISSNNPSFLFKEKKNIKKHLKTSLKNIKKCEKIKFFDILSQNFAEKVETYLNARYRLTELILENFSKFDFDENGAVLEISSINPILCSLLPDFFDEDFNVEDFETRLKDLEDKYVLSYLEKIKVLEKKLSKERQRVENVIVETSTKNNVGRSVTKADEKKTIVENKKSNVEEKSSQIAPTNKKTATSGRKGEKEV